MQKKISKKPNPRTTRLKPIITALDNQKITKEFAKGKFKLVYFEELKSGTFNLRGTVFDVNVTLNLKELQELKDILNKIVNAKH